MKRKSLCWVVSVALSVTFATVGQAQEILRPDTVTGMEDVDRGAFNIRPSMSVVANEEAGASAVLPDTLAADTTGWIYRPSMPLSCRDGDIAYFPTSRCGGCWDLWELHEGFNAGVDMSVSASFGRHRFPGVGVGTGISSMYVRSLTDRLVVAAGSFYDHISWNGLNENRFGINLLAGYRLTDRLCLYAYGGKSFLFARGFRSWMPPMPWLEDFSSRFGGMVHFKFSDAVSVSLSVEEKRWD